MTDLKATIKPAVTSIYGDNMMSEALITWLVEKMPEWDETDRDREEEIRLACWNFFSGGDTAQVAARRIMAALEEAS